MIGQMGVLPPSPRILYGLKYSIQESSLRTCGSPFTEFLEDVGAQTEIIGWVEAPVDRLNCSGSVWVIMPRGLVRNRLCSWGVDMRFLGCF